MGTEMYLFNLKWITEIFVILSKDTNNSMLRVKYVFL